MGYILIFSANLLTWWKFLVCMLSIVPGDIFYRLHIRKIKKTEILVHVFFEDVTYALFTRGIDILHAILTNCQNGGWLSVKHIS